MTKGEIQLRIANRLLSPCLSYGFSVAVGVASPAHSPQADENAQVIEVSAKKYEFNPSEIRVPRGARIQLKVHSADVTHGVKLDVYPEGAKDKSTPGLVFDQPSENAKVAKGVDQVLNFIAKDSGTYDFKCAKLSGFGHERMRGKLVVG
jgi:cytochrome c oxidase subunit II